MVRVFEVGSRVLLAAPQRQQALPSHSLPARQAAARQEPAFRLAAQATAYADRAQANTADLRAATNTPYNTALTGERKSMLSGGEGSYAPQEHHKSHEDLWETVREETIENARHEPSLASSLHASILAHDSLGKMLAFILANKLQCSTLLGAHLMVLFQEAFADENIMDAVVADLNAVYDRDPACETYSQCILNFKGFQAIQAHRVSHWLWLRGRKVRSAAVRNCRSSPRQDVLGAPVGPAPTLFASALLPRPDLAPTSPCSLLAPLGLRERPPREYSLPDSCGAHLCGLHKHSDWSSPESQCSRLSLAQPLSLPFRQRLNPPPWCEMLTLCLPGAPQALALLMQSRISEVFHVDIHPGAQIGRGIMIDHATGVVIGETTVVGDNVSILHHVTLGGSGRGGGRRHPLIGHGSLLGAGVCCIGPVTVGKGSKVGAGTLVVEDLPDYCVAVGVPAKVLRRKEGQEPRDTMDQCEYIYDYII
uniref:serine O-acetyltransferase n=1 Tax=Tetraselmis sp. GSL018 TaxID=582737 RepID=A0A061SHN3_9CHLO|eukprot:CAMPEP_0177587060 /NCGR_PEP_ID=MMETSP0419_2-20121207/5426_1 /TAXON_ID=582737 /ORGANISM="Tetraselmis sp., Strain GSL018" /LENGTH=478 /DNA_ID=CAMNT_0019077037 /DNA_START=505 /DNA_END=1941 /DNA_ORIENTATION=-